MSYEIIYSIAELLTFGMFAVLFIALPFWVGIELHRLNKKLKVRDDYDLRISMLEHNVVNLINEIVFMEDNHDAT